MSDSGTAITDKIRDVGEDLARSFRSVLDAVPGRPEGTIGFTLLAIRDDGGAVRGRQLVSGPRSRAERGRASGPGARCG